MRRFVTVRLACVLAVTCGLFSAEPAFAQSLPVTRVEEDWELHVGQPDPQVRAPQVAIIFAPDADDDCPHAIFELNASSLDASGNNSLQLQAWLNDTVLAVRSAPTSSRLRYAGEVVRFTTVIEVADGTLHFRVKDGQSSSFGTFGANTGFDISVATDHADLSAFSPTTSLEYSSVTFGANRVDKLSRTGIRYYTQAGLLSETAEESIIVE